MPRKKQHIIEIDNLTVHFGEYTALEDITLKIAKGSITSIIGPNGSGKTTLAKAIIGLVRPAEGSITIDGNTVEKSIGRIGYVPQRFSFDKTLPITVKEFLRLSICKTKEHKKKDEVTSALKLVGMQGVDNKQLGALSGGQLQRILIARALLHERDIMILDEPSSGIDAAGERDLYELIQRINKKKKTTFIIVSHELDFVSRFSDSVICLNKKLICHDTPKKALLCKGVKELYGPHVEVHVHHSHS